jgi:hypothetical protein
LDRVAPRARLWRYEDDVDLFSSPTTPKDVRRSTDWLLKASLGQQRWSNDGPKTAMLAILTLL